MTKSRKRSTILIYYNITFSDVMLSDLSEVPFIKIGDYTLEFEFGPPSPEIQEVARKELRETPEVQKQAIARFRELLKGSTECKKSDKLI